MATPSAMARHDLYVICGLVAYLFLGEALQPLQILGVLLVIAAVAILQLRHQGDDKAPALIRLRNQAVTSAPCLVTQHGSNHHSAH